MSLDVSLYIPSNEKPEQEEKIFIRENGCTKEISRDEWDERFPGQEPVTSIHESEDGEQEVYSANITHNLNKMAFEAELYMVLWRPDELAVGFASEITSPLREGLQRLKADPEHFKKFNPKNGWGNYEALVSFVENYLNACVKHPHAKIEICR